jgi:glycosyltransferase involved in cell wall biosynthesis
MFEMHLSPAAVLALRDVPAAGVVMYYKPICPNGRKLWPDGTLCDVRAGAVCVRTGCVPPALAPRELARYALIGRAMRRMAALATCSEWMAGKLARNGLAATPLHLPIEPPPPGYRREPAADPVFVYVGRLAAEKGVDDLLDAFAATRARHPRATLRIVGDGPEAPRLRTRAGAGVVFRGEVPRERVADEWRDAWAAVVPSRWAEPYGMVAAEAIAHRVPVVASATGGLAEIVEEGRTGLLFPNGDVAALTGRLDEATRRFGTSGADEDASRAFVERRSTARHLAELEAVLAAARESAARRAAG